MTAYKNQLTFINSFMLALIALILIVLVNQNMGHNNIVEPVVVLNELQQKKVTPGTLEKKVNQIVVQVKTSEQKKTKNNQQVRSQLLKKSKIIPVSQTKALANGKKIQGQKNVPRLIGHFNLPIILFLQKVEKKGAKLVVYDKRKGTLIGQIHKKHWYKNVKLQGMSLRTRQITKDLPIKLRQEYNTIVQNNYGTGLMEYLVLLPMELDAHFWGLISEILKKNKMDLLKLDVIDFSYVQLNQQIHLLINQVEVKGKSYPINVSAHFL